MASGVQKINDFQFFSPYHRLIIDFSTFRIFGPDIDQESELNFHLEKLISEYGWMKKIKWGSSCPDISVYHKFFVLCGSS